MKRKGIISFVFLTFLLTGLRTEAQPEHLRFGHLRNDHGLSQNSGRSIKQDREGYIWIATESGLNRYDGRNFEIFRFIPGSSNCISNNYLNAIETGLSHYVYIGTDGKGLDILDTETGIITNAGGHDSTLKDGSAFIYSLASSSSGNLYVGTGNGLFLFSHTDNTLKTLVPPAVEGNVFFRNLMLLNNGNVIAASNRGLFLISTKNNEISTLHSGTANCNCFAETENDLILAGCSNGLTAFKITEGKLKPDTSSFFIKQFEGIRINDIVYDKRNKTIWIASDEKGLFAVSLLTKTIRNYRPELRLPQSLTTDKIKTLFLDNAGILWIGTYFNGVHFLNTRRKKLNPSVLKYGENFLTSITGVTTDTSGNIWLGSLNGTYMYSVSENNVSHFPEDTKGIIGPVNGFVTSLFCDSRGHIWNGTDGGLSLYADGKFKVFIPDTTKPGSISGNSVWGFSEDKDGNVWIATWDGGISCYNSVKGDFTNYLPENSGLSVRNTNAVLCDNRHRVWAGTWEKGLDMLDTKTGKWKNFSYNQKDSSSISHNIILSLFEDKNGNIWAGTFGGGLNIIDGETLKIRRITQVNGLSDNSVQGIKEDKKGNLWCFTMRGVSKINPVSFEIKNYEMEDGLQGSEFSQNGSHVCKNGYILASGPGGFNYFDPDSVFDNYFSPPVYLSSLYVNNQIVNPYDTLFFKTRLADTDTIYLEWNKNNLGFSFISLHYANPGRINYACKLEPFDVEWVQLGNNPVIRYVNLPPGEYTLLYKATNCDGIWINEAKKFTIIIIPPFWSTWWFITLIIILSVALVVSFIIFREKTLKRRNRILEKKVEERTYEITQQKEEILAQRDEIEAQRDMVINQKEEITHIHDELTSSIRYAQRIQEAMLPALDVFSNANVDHFLIFRPRDIVSGDFYWAARMDNILIVTVADCTGHGVPGAFMSMLGIAFLKEIVQKEYITQPAIILRRLRKEIVKSLKQKEDPNQKDGMDIALCAINLDTLEMQFAGANNPLYLVTGDSSLVTGEASQQPATSNQQLIELKGDKMPIGMHARMDNFTLHTYQLHKGDCIYLFSDGIADQFGGPAGKKFKYKALKELLTSLSWQPVERQKRMVELNFDEWKGRLEQVDDVTLLGLII